MRLSSSASVALVWPVATYDCESWHSEETLLDASEMKELRNAGFMHSKENTVKARKLA